MSPPARPTIGHPTNCPTGEGEAAWTWTEVGAYFFVGAYRTFLRVNVLTLLPVLPSWGTTLTPPLNLDSLLAVGMSFIRLPKPRTAVRPADRLSPTLIALGAALRDLYESGARPRGVSAVTRRRVEAGVAKWASVEAVARGYGKRLVVTVEEDGGAP